jgi:hypothetical protein
MKKILFGLVVIALVTSCEKANNNPHVANANCGSCHTTEQSQWASSKDLHALSAADVLTNVDHNTAELLTNDCLKCHATFQYKLGVAHFVTPVDQIGAPSGTWTALNPGEWKATKCEVCHDPTATNKSKLAKYGSLLDGQWSASYNTIAAMPAAYQKVINISTGDTSTFIYPDQTTLAVQATKLCNSCHDPADQGGDPEVIVGGINYGSQGGDSRSYVATNHQGFGCIDCHNPHDFMPVDPKVTLACNSCHSDNKTGKVHVNHL